MEIELIFAVIGFLLGAATIIYPLYLWSFIYWRLNAEKRQQPKPSWAFMVGYSLVVLVFLSFVLWPIFFHRPSGCKQCDARTNLGAIFTAQADYFANTKTYSSDITLMNWKPRHKSIYAFTCGDNFISNRKGDPIPATAIPKGIAQVSDTGFTCMAVGNIDNDTTLDYWTINDAKSITNTPTSDLEL